MAGPLAFLRDHFVEASLFLYTLGVVMQWPVTQSLLLDKSCRRSFSRAECDSLADRPEMEAAVQSEAAFWLTTLPSLNGLITAFSALLLGRASDRWGRGRVLAFSCAGGLTMGSVLLLQTALEGLSPVLLVAGTLASGLSGGIFAFMSTLMDFVTDTTPAEGRTGRLSLVQPFAGLGVVFGMLLSGLASKHLGFRAVYLFFVATQLVVLAMAVAFVWDRPGGRAAASRTATPVPDADGSGPRRGAVAEVAASLTAGVRLCLKPRPGHQRKHLLFLVLGGFVAMIGVGGDMAVNVLYTRRAPFHWEQPVFGYFVAAINVSSVLGMALGTRPLLKLIGTGTPRDDLILLQIGQLAGIASALTMASATKSFHLLLVPLLCFLGGPSQAAGGSFTSKLVQPTEKGAFSAFTSFLNNLAMPLGTLVYSTIYSWTSTSSLPNCVYLVKVVMLTIPLALTTMMKRDLTKAE